MLEIPLLDNPNQKLSVILANRRATLSFWYNTTTDRWSFDLSLDNEPIIQGQRIVLGVNLLRYRNLKVGAIFAHSDTGAVPDRQGLVNGDIKIFYMTEAELDAAVPA